MPFLREGEFPDLEGELVTKKLEVATEYDFLLKVVLIGDSGVGKSNILLRYTTNTFTSAQISTIGVDFATQAIQRGEEVVKLQIWDTAGQERFKTITSAYYRGAAAIVLVYDISKRESFDNLSKWLREIRDHASSDVVMLLMGSKSDLTKDRVISIDEGMQFAFDNGMDFIEVSASNGSNIDKAFHRIVHRVRTQINETHP